MNFEDLPPLFYKLDGHTPVPVGMDDQPDHAHVADTHIPTVWGDVRVSTVFLGIDHGMTGLSLKFGDAPEPPYVPILFETMIFCGPEGLDQWQERYATWKQAEAGHDVAIQMVRAAAIEAKAKNSKRAALMLLGFGALAAAICAVAFWVLIYR